MWKLINCQPDHNMCPRVRACRVQTDCSFTHFFSWVFNLAQWTKNRNTEESSVLCLHHNEERSSGDNQAWLGLSQSGLRSKHAHRQLLKVVWGKQHINKSGTWQSHRSVVYWVNKHTFEQAVRLVNLTGPVGEEEVVLVHLKGFKNMDKQWLYHRELIGMEKQLCLAFTGSRLKSGPPIMIINCICFFILLYYCCFWIIYSSICLFLNFCVETRL